MTKLYLIDEAAGILDEVQAWFLAKADNEGWVYTSVLRQLVNRLYRDRDCQAKRQKQGIGGVPAARRSRLQQRQRHSSGSGYEPGMKVDVGLGVGVGAGGVEAIQAATTTSSTAQRSSRANGSGWRGMGILLLRNAHRSRALHPCGDREGEDAVSEREVPKPAAGGDGHARDRSRGVGANDYDDDYDDDHEHDDDSALPSERATCGGRGRYAGEAGGGHGQSRPWRQQRTPYSMQQQQSDRSDPMTKLYLIDETAGILDEVQAWFLAKADNEGWVYTAVLRQLVNRLYRDRDYQAMRQKQGRHTAYDYALDRDQKALA
jgi:hypothetical protein